jgi:hypothetical protein
MAFNNLACVLLEPHPVVKAMALNAHRAMLRGAAFRKRITKLSSKRFLGYMGERCRPRQGELQNLRKEWSS